MMLINDSPVPSYEFDEYLQEICQSFNEMYGDSHSFVVLDCSFFGFLFQDQVCEDQDDVSDEMHEQGSETLF